MSECTPRLRPSAHDMTRRPFVDDEVLQFTPAQVEAGAAATPT